MGRHTKTAPGHWRFARGTALLVIWLGGLAAGFFAILSAAARYSCGHTARGLACRPAGSALGVVMILFVIAIVTAVTVLTHDRGPRRLVAVTVLGALALLACYVAAHTLIGTA
ncbi:MAG: hypothetical protein JWO57_3656 [Pseudonocardiales bacterium]|nr:hypothetical protein [Pseudonocardiales bacterium]